MKRRLFNKGGWLFFQKATRGTYGLSVSRHWQPCRLTLRVSPRGEMGRRHACANMHVCVCTQILSGAHEGSLTGACLVSVQQVQKFFCGWRYLLREAQILLVLICKTSTNWCVSCWWWRCLRQLSVSELENKEKAHVYKTNLVKTLFCECLAYFPY